jgi:acyl carrier protein
MTTTFDAIRAIIVRDFELPAERLRPDTLLEEIELDSLAITELVFAIEDEFKITAESTIPPFKTLGDIADYVARLVAERDTKPRGAPKSAEAAAVPSEAATTPATPKRPRAAKKANGKAKSGANGAKHNGGATRVKAARGASGSARAEPSCDAPERKPKRSGGSRVGARAR